MTSPDATPDNPAGHLAIPRAETPECYEDVGVNMPEAAPPPEPSANAPVAERDAHWRKHVYLADRQRQFTLRAVVVGGVLGGLMSITTLYITLKIGWGLSLVLLATLGTYSGTKLLARFSRDARVWQFVRYAVTLALLAGLGFTLHKIDPELLRTWTARGVVGGVGVAIASLFLFWPRAVSEFSMLENAAMSSVAGTASSTTGMCLVGAFGGMLLIDGKHPDPWALAAVLGSNAVLGVALSIPMKRRMVNEENLPYPSPKAGAVMLKSLYADGREGLIKARALFVALGVGALVGLFRSWESLNAAFKKAEQPSGFLETMSRWTIPEEISFRSVSEWAAAKSQAAQAGAATWGAAVAGWIGAAAAKLNGLLPLADRGLTLQGLAFEPSLLLVSVGMIVGVRVALSMFLGSVILHFILVPAMFSADQAYIAAHGAEGFRAAMPVIGKHVAPAKWALWGGTALMVVSSFATLGLQAGSLMRSFSKMLAPKASGGDPVADLEIPLTWAFWLGVPAAVGVVLAQWWGFGVHPLLGVAAVGISFGISIVCCRAAAEADINPIGAMGKVSQLVFAFLPGAAGNAATNLLSAGSTSSAGGASADMMGDHKASRLIGANPRQVLYAQLSGILFGVVCVVPAWFALVPDKATLESGEKYTAIPAQMWSAVARLLTSKDPSLPYGATTLMVVCALLGLIIPLVAHFFPKIGRWMPSTMGLGLSLVLPFSNALSFAIGALIMVAWDKGHRKSAAFFALILASGLMSGQAIAESFALLGGEALGLIHRNGWW